MMTLSRYIVEIGDPHIDEAWCTCGDKFRSSEQTYPARRNELMVWAYRHQADHLDITPDEDAGVHG